MTEEFSRSSGSCTPVVSFNVSDRSPTVLTFLVPSRSFRVHESPLGGPSTLTGSGDWSITEGTLVVGRGVEVRSRGWGSFTEVSSM